MVGIERMLDIGFRIGIKANSIDPENTRDFGLTAEISNCSSCHLIRPLQQNSSEYFDEIGPIGMKLLEDLFDLFGIEEVFIKPYQLSIKKGSAFKWDEIEESIIEALSETFGSADQIEILRFDLDEVSIVDSSETIIEYLLRR